jgi:membrane peptidoglycan carboxypeptidase
MWSGFGKSINTYFVPLEERVGAENVVDVAKRFGIQFRAANDAKLAATKESAHLWGAFTLGVSSSTPLELANAYATLAGDGMYCEPTPVQEIKTQKGQKIDVGNPHCTRATSADVARSALDAARCPVGDQSQVGRCSGATARAAHATVKHPVFGKTGTTEGEKAAGLIVGTTKLVVSAYLVNPDWAQHRDRMDHDVVNPPAYETLADYMKGKPKEEFKKPGNRKLTFGEQRSIPGVKCASIADARSRIAGAGFDPSVQSIQVDSECPAGTAAGTNPDGRTIKGGVVVIEVSNGKGGAKPKPGDGPVINLPGFPRPRR